MPRALRSRNFTFTLFNYTSSSIDICKEFDCVWLIFQTEMCPTTHRAHLQGALSLGTPLSMKGLKRLFTIQSIHLEIMIGTPMESRIYCTKMESRLQLDFQSFEKGVCPANAGNRADIREVLAASLINSELIMWDLYPSQMLQYGRRVMRYVELHRPLQTIRPVTTVLWGGTGTGKSYRARTRAIAAGGAEPYRMPPPINTTTQPWTDGYAGQTDVILEDFAGDIAYRNLLQMLDEYPLRTPTKGGFVQWAPKRVWITSNLHPREWYPNNLWEDGPLQRRLEEEPSMIINIIAREDAGE